MKYRAEIDGLRAVAVVPVVFFHAGIGIFSGGFVGVDVFFVISGYLITTIMLEEIQRGQFSIVNFYERRARRILPALFFIMFCCIPFALYLLLPVEMKSFFKSLSTVATFSSNIQFMLETNYFNPATDLIPLIHTWSLAVEEQYYIFAPLFMVLMWRFGTKVIVVFLLVLLAVSLVLAQWALTIVPEKSFFLLPSRLWEILLGALCAFYLLKKGINKNMALANLMSFTGLMLIGLAVFSFGDTTPMPSFFGLIPTVGAALIILFSSSSTVVGALLSYRPIVGIGLVSYSAYLWHQPILAFAKVYTFDQLTPLIVGICLLAIPALSYLTWRFVEAPFRDKSRFTKTQVLRLSAGGIIFFVSVGLFGYLTDGSLGITQSTEVQELKTAREDWEFPGQLRQVGDSDLFVVDKDRAIDTLFFGDSHIKQYGPLINKLAIQSNVNVGFLTIGGCPPVPNAYYLGSAKCTNLVPSLMNLLEKNSSINTVFVGGCFSCYFIETKWSVRDLTQNLYLFDNGERLEVSKQSPDIIIGEFLKFVRDLSEKVNVIVVLDNPVSNNFSPSLLMAELLSRSKDFFYEKYPDFKKGSFEVDKHQLELSRKLSNAFKNNRRIKVLDPTQFVCPDNICLARNYAGKPKYRDLDHMRPFFVENTLGKLFSDYFDAKQIVSGSQ